MSNKRKLRTLTGSGFQRTPDTWKGRSGNRTAIAEAQKVEEESRKPKFIPRPKADLPHETERTDRVIYDEPGSV